MSLIPPHQNAASRDDEAALWCMRLGAAPVGAVERAAFDAWIADDPANAMAFEEAFEVWQAMDAARDMPEMIRFRAEAVEALRDANERRWSRGLRAHWRGVVAAAACLALAFLLAVHFFYDPARVYETGLGERRVVMMEDGTRLTLDAATRVEARMEDDSRRIELVSGRARFDVAHDPLRPLSVLARNRLTVATGTAFSVELLPRQMRVVLYEGKVEVMERPRDGKPVNLLGNAHGGAALVPGRELVASTEGRQVRVAEADISRSRDWESGQLSFDGEPLALAVERINRDAKDKLIVADPGIANFAIVGTFNAGDTEAFLEGVSELYPVRVERGEGAVILKKGG
ncbi:FecR family protein [Sphingomonas laterariae]|uniref:FecR family protein n=1 Tax=Edaphosphingomonas laterariae TaxID=861865 RepID=A0A239J352_9SPHN|nr:FecR domain-containing protein [Sphingomonas laterariae]SNT00466.1 FecR family protein [Sphingomonas laterariae]